MSTLSGFVGAGAGVGAGLAQAAANGKANNAKIRLKNNNFRLNLILLNQCSKFTFRCLFVIQAFATSSKKPLRFSNGKVI